MNHFTKSLYRFLAVLISFLLLYAAVIVLLDPFVQYHKPILGDRMPLTDSYNRVIGTIRHYEYDSLLVGDSLVENCNTDPLDAAYGRSMLKVVKESGSMADLLYLVSEAHKEQELKTIVWGLNYSQLAADSASTINPNLDIYYLYTRNPFDDIPYVFNKDILFKTIPTLLYDYMEGNNMGGDAYNWSSGKTFSEAQANSVYDRSGFDGVITDVSQEYDYSDFYANLDAFTKEIESHPETEYVILLPPVSRNWWDSAYINGEIEVRYRIWKETLEALSVIPNVRIYSYQLREEWVGNLDLYMDLIHVSQETDDAMIAALVNEEGMLTNEMIPEYMEEMRAMVERLENTYYEQGGNGNE